MPETRLFRMAQCSGSLTKHDLIIVLELARQVLSSQEKLVVNGGRITSRYRQDLVNCLSHSELLGPQVEV